MANNNTDTGDILADSKQVARMLNKEKKWFGLKMDADMRSFVNPAWIMGMAYLKGAHGDKVEKQASRALDALGAQSWTKEGSLGARVPFLRKAGGNPKYLAATFFGLLAASPLLPSFVAPVTKWRETRADMANKLMPVFQDMQSDGRPSSLGGIDVTDNEVIWAARKRLNNSLTHKTVNNMLELGSSQVIQFIGEKGQSTGVKGLKNKLTPKQIEKAGELAAAKGDASSFLSILPGAVDMVVNRFTKARDDKFHAERISASSYEMITNLVEELKDHKGSPDKLLKEQFSYPRNVGSRSDTLANYIATTIRAHAEDMARFFPDQYTELRDSLKKEELKDVSKTLAEAIVSGDLPALSLVRLIGEGHIIKNAGRGLVDVESLKDHIEQSQTNIRSYARVEPSEYMQRAIFTEAEAKETFQSLDAEKRVILASMMPTSVLKKIGLSEAEINESREKTASVYEENLAHLVVGIAQTPEEELKKGGLSASEIKAIQQASETIMKDGVEAAHKMRANPNQPIGIEHQLLNATLPKMHVGETDYLGTVIQVGQKKLAGEEVTQSENESRESMGKHAQKIAEHSDVSKHSGQEKAAR